MLLRPTQSLEALASAVRAGELRAQALVEEAVAAHETLGHRLNAYVEWGGEEALRQAKRIDQRVASGDDPGPLAGIPVSVKDLYGVEGFRTRAGTPAELPGAWETSGPFIAGLAEAGAVFMGKTHTVEMAFGGVGINPHRGTPVNPWDASKHRVPGGSSSGAGVSLWEGSALVALGTDTGGSIRIPASATGVAGHKTTAGRWSTEGVVPLSQTLDTVGALTRTVLDSAYFFSAVDGTTVPECLIGQLRIGVPIETASWSASQEDVARVVADAVEALRTSGATVIEVDAPELDQATEAYMTSGIAAAECAAFLRRSLPSVHASLDPTVGARLSSALDMKAADYLDALARRKALAQLMVTRFEDVDLLVSPTLPMTPPTVSSLAHLEDYFQANRRMLSNTCPASYLGLCALSLPVGLDDCGMPVGMQLMAPGGLDPSLLGWGMAIEGTLGTATTLLGTPGRTPP
ncbi:MAG: amidase [Gemmatimonadota bacterium]|nr:amidase [Gemmatimonadota bacterium]